MRLQRTSPTQGSNHSLIKYLIQPHCCPSFQRQRRPECAPPLLQKQALVDGSCPTQWSDTLFCPAAEDALVTNCAMSLFFENTCR